MKKIFLIALLVAFAGGELSANGPAAKKKKRRGAQTEGVRFGIRGGLNMANMSIKDSDPGPKSLMSFHFGGVVEYMLSENLSFEAGLLYSGKGSKTEFYERVDMMGMYYELSGDVKFAPSYLEIPINAVYKVPVGDNHLLIYGGPYLGFGIGGKSKGDLDINTNIPGFDPATLGIETSYDESIKFGSSEEDDLKGMDFGLNIGAGFEFSGIQVRAQYGLGLANLSTYSEGDIKNKVIGISVAYMFGN
ncbi:MAG TPA: porin family protein [Bacteroidales bacterium]|nr:porin family protein [Bacteroidales bacterium]HSA42101.1 porin family protein [Bacteroidales bacterium]